MGASAAAGTASTTVGVCAGVGRGRLLRGAGASIAVDAPSTVGRPAGRRRRREAGVRRSGRKARRRRRARPGRRRRARWARGPAARSPSAHSGIRAEPPTRSRAVSCSGRHAGRRDRAAQGVHRPVDVRRDQLARTWSDRAGRRRGTRRTGSAPRPRSRSSASPSRGCTRAGPARPASRRRAATCPDALQHQLVEVEAAEVVDRLGDARHREAATGRPGPAQHGRVAPAAPRSPGPRP